MMKSRLMYNMVFMLAAVVVVAFASSPAEAVISCGDVLRYVSSCVPYLTQGGPISGCCDGVKGLNSAAQSTPDRQSVCKCLKTLASSVPNIDLGKAAGLPAKCGVNVPYKISPSTDCSKVK